MNVLFLSPDSIDPPRHGAGVRIRHLAEQLSIRHRVTVISFAFERESRGAIPPPPFEHVHLRWSTPRPGPVSRWLDRFGLLGQTAASPENTDVVSRILRSRCVDVVVGQYLTIAPLLPSLRGTPVVWAADGIFSELRHPSLKPWRNPYRRLQDWVEYLWWRRLESWAWRQADVLVAVSEPEGEELRRRVGSGVPVVVAPNGADCESLASVGPSLGSRRALFVGSTWHPNVEALHFFADEVFPLIRKRLPDFRVFAAGGIRESRHLRTHLPEGIDLLGWVDDLRPVFSSAGVFIAPILRGHGTRIKILEALAAGMPVVSTRKGAEGLDIVNGRDLVLADDPGALANAVVQLVESPDVAARLSEAARRVARERYDWPVVAARLEEALQRAVQSGSWREVSASTVPAPGTRAGGSR